MVDVGPINDWLKKQGLNPYGKPLFRLVWSDDQYEVRRGVFNDFAGDLFLRTVNETRKVCKYSYIHERWVMELWYPPDLTNNPELPETREGSYEPIFVFEDKNGNYLEPCMRAVGLIVWHILNPTKDPPGEKMSREQKRDEKEVEKIEYELDTSSVQAALHLKEAIGYTKEIKDA